MPRKGRARRFREARKLKQGYDDGLFREGSGTLADVSEGAGAMKQRWEAEKTAISALRETKSEIEQLAVRVEQAEHGTPPDGTFGKCVLGHLRAR